VAGMNNVLDSLCTSI